MDDGTYTVILDRIVDDSIAVLLREKSQHNAKDQLEVSLEMIPEAAKADGEVLTIKVADGEVEELNHEPNTTSTRREEMAEKLDRLSRPLSDETNGE